MKTNYRSKIEELRHKYLRGELTIEQAKVVATPWILEMNKIGERIAKEHGRAFKKFTFGYLFR